jgi:hypothetical protein
MFTFKKLMVAMKKKNINEFNDVWLKHGDLVTTLKNFDDEDKFKLFKFPHMKEYDHELHSESALSCIFIIYGESRENLHHQFVPPELVRYFSKKKQQPE